MTTGMLPSPSVTGGLAEPTPHLPSERNLASSPWCPPHLERPERDFCLQVFPLVQRSAHLCNFNLGLLSLRETSDDLPIRCNYSAG